MTQVKFTKKQILAVAQALHGQRPINADRSIAADLAIIAQHSLDASAIGFAMGIDWDDMDGFRESCGVQS